MTVSDETLMAYADGEVDAATRAVIEAAMRDDPEVRSRVAHHRALREAMQGAFAEVLVEPVPPRLIAAARGTPGAIVVDIAGARAPAAPNRPAAVRSWQPVAMAASVLLGLALGYFGWHSSNGLVNVGPGGELVARANLAEALSSELSADPSPGTVATPGLSFRDKNGDYCRTFELAGSHASSGLACREGSRWMIKVLAQSPGATANSSAYRPASSAASAAVRAAIEDSIAGEPLDRAAEIAARDANWSPPRSAERPATEK